jgi:hypothetical protein
VIAVTTDCGVAGGRLKSDGIPAGGVQGLMTAPGDAGPLSVIGVAPASLGPGLVGAQAAMATAPPSAVIPPTQPSRMTAMAAATYAGSLDMRTPLGREWTVIRQRRSGHQGVRRRSSGKASLEPNEAPSERAAAMRRGTDENRVMS